MIPSLSRAEGWNPLVCDVPAAIVGGMTEPIAYLDGDWVPCSAARLSVADLGIVQAATVTEMIRTFGHRPFRVDEHLARLRHSLEVTDIANVTLVEQLPPVIEHIVHENSRHISPTDDLGIVIIVTAGLQSMYAGDDCSTSPTVCVHTFSLPFARWADRYYDGVHLIVPSVRAMPVDVIDPRIKYRSRLHWFLADREVRKSDPTAMALLANEQGHLTETNSGNLILFDDETLLSPPASQVLGGISQEVVFELAERHGIARKQDDITLADVSRASEAFVSSTTYCLLPVTRINDQPVGNGNIGPLFGKLIDDWSDLVDTDILSQAQQAGRSTNS